MTANEETIDATIEPNGQLRLTHPPRLPPGPVSVTIRAATGPGPKSGLAEVAREIAARQRAQGFPGRSAEQLQAEEEERLADDVARDQEFDASRGSTSPGEA